MHAFAGMPWEAPFREVEALMAGWGGRPHWGKRSFLGAAELAPRYPRWDAFAASRAVTARSCSNVASVGHRCAA